MPVIRSKLEKRPGGFSVTLGDRTYEFRDNERGEQVCVVDNPADVMRLLSIEEAYEIVPEESKQSGDASDYQQKSERRSFARTGANMRAR
jgi:hypothetical protein